MNIFGACMLFVVLVLIFLAITEIFTILFRFAGLPAERARFQVTSLLTCCGFTTKESEIILSSPQRRRLARATMLFGYVFSVSIVSSLVNIFLSVRLTEVESLFWRLPLPLLLLLPLLFLRHDARVRSAVDAFFERLANRLLARNGANSLLLLDYISSSAIAQVELRELPEPLRDVPLRSSGLREMNVLVMLLRRGGAEARPMGADEAFLAGDQLIVCGPLAEIRRAFHAREGALAEASD